MSERQLQVFSAAEELQWRLNMIEEREAMASKAMEEATATLRELRDARLRIVDLLMENYQLRWQVFALQRAAVPSEAASSEPEAEASPTSPLSPARSRSRSPRSRSARTAANAPR